MEKTSFSTPAVYGDHHVLEVRQILMAIPGVVEVYVSSCFHVIEVSYDPVKTTSEAIASRLEAAGYLEGISFPGEDSTPAYSRRAKINEHIRTMVGFMQDIPVQARRVWPCPGMGLLKSQEGKRG